MMLWCYDAKKKCCYDAMMQKKTWWYDAKMLKKERRHGAIMLYWPQTGYHPITFL